MFRISTLRKFGGIWNGERLTKTFETDDAKTAADLKAQGYTVEELEQTPEDMNVPQLKKYAKEHGVDLGGATQKAPILELINAAEKE